ncbi:bifunctional phosphoribosyl-AMP cyclohydrolase/phosphoribosyl-ATP diphosphatase HisIE [Sporosarcina jiandibaonis]|uniref:bifunctional phosphoribosyl-AMP cyclohydrolase/phosphoribosyl-ATP diphosphatase HisIE n=1 Tax=Sporosarcina jiandibaonis TaxID=2715535 RepID=UPI001557EFD2|nr:bifunctional phosphoribosyl-AMP cyclohydrolase/phosphoribosyl-ATP diphosphatase HisIE [Sporosarcina jiandibaonis]
MTIEIESVSFDEKGLVPAIVQDSQSGKVLMLAYMNEDALTKTIETKETWFFSRSRQELWHKGATSGNRQIVKQLSFDCDSDAVLVQVEPMGPACHTGETSCFYKTGFESETSNREIVHEIISEIKNRRVNPVEGSYTSYLFREGIDKVLKKVGEESSEVIIGAKNEDKAELTSELADLLYHSLVLMEIADVSLSDIKDELLKRRA